MLRSVSSAVPHSAPPLTRVPLLGIESVLQADSPSHSHKQCRVSERSQRGFFRSFAKRIASQRIRSVHTTAAWSCGKPDADDAPVQLEAHRTSATRQNTSPGHLIGKNHKPLWYAVYADRWAHACIGLSAFHGITYWDAGGSWGGIGLDTADRQRVRMSYVIHPGAKDASFAEAEYRQLSAPPQARWEN
ncbi:MAG: hypothetical protein GXY83_31435 [Rhodopirellula sp.]|nr:hypothetical protein [Rhodopirellula sp.]